MESKPDFDQDADQVLCDQCAGLNSPDATRCVQCHSPLASASGWGDFYRWELLVRRTVRGPLGPGAESLIVLVLLIFAAMMLLGFLYDWSRSSRTNDLVSALIVLVSAWAAWRALARWLKRR